MYPHRNRRILPDPTEERRGSNRSQNFNVDNRHEKSFRNDVVNQCLWLITMQIRSLKDAFSRSRVPVENETPHTFILSFTFRYAFSFYTLKMKTDREMGMTRSWCGTFCYRLELTTILIKNQLAYGNQGVRRHTTVYNPWTVDERGRKFSY